MMQEPADVWRSPLQGPPPVPSPAVFLGPPMPSASPVTPGFQVSSAFLGPSAHSEPQVPRSTAKKLWQNHTVFTQEQKRELEEAFEHCPYPTYKDRVVLATKIHMKEIQVQDWFKSRRATPRRNSQQQPAMCVQKPEVTPVAPVSVSKIILPSLPEYVPSAAGPAVAVAAPEAAPEAAPDAAEIPPGM